MKKYLLVVSMALVMVACQKKSGEKVSFIDADTQAFSEKVLSKQIDSVDASAGAMAVMEVSTGNIIAWVELAKTKEPQSNDSLFEENSHLLRTMMAPGSLFFPVSMMIALEDKKVKLSDTIDTGAGLWMFMSRPLKDHNYNSGGYGLINAEQAVTLSSNIGIAKIIYSGYENEMEKFNVEITNINWDNSAECEYKNILDSHSQVASNKMIVWQAIGYDLQTTPIAMLGYYNAIANKGRMVQSRRAGELCSKVIIDKHICSKATLKALQQCLSETVAKGTGKPAQSSLVTIAGKTGNAQEFDNAKKRTINIVSFCGYFPADKPQYSCIVVLRDPQNGIPSGGRMAGVVFKEVAEWLMAN
jgi:cell division protein FtsI (penicillin-binding protein 3)